MQTTPVLRRIGFFYLLPVTDRIHALRALAQPQAAAREAEVINYLESGHVFAAVPGVEDDVLSPDKRIIGALHILTDGCFAWPSTLSYWVKRYHLLLPQELLDHMQRCGWCLPNRFDPTGIRLD